MNKKYRLFEEWEIKNYEFGKLRDGEVIGGVKFLEI